MPMYWRPQPEHLGPGWRRLHQSDAGVARRFGQYAGGRVVHQWVSRAATLHCTGAESGPPGSRIRRLSSGQGRQPYLAISLRHGLPYTTTIATPTTFPRFAGNEKLGTREDKEPAPSVFPQAGRSGSQQLPPNHLPNPIQFRLDRRAIPSDHLHAQPVAVRQDGYSGLSRCAVG